MDKYLVVFGYNGDGSEDESGEELDDAVQKELLDRLRSHSTVCDDPALPLPLVRRSTYCTLVLPQEEFLVRKRRRGGEWRELGLLGPGSTLAQIGWSALTLARGRRACKLLADRIFDLAGRLPHPGSCLVQVLWVTSCLPETRKAPEIAGALARLCNWHQAGLEVVGGGRLTDSWRQVSRWIGTPDDSRHVWRGWLEMSNPESCDERNFLPGIGLCSGDSSPGAGAATRKSPRCIRKKNPPHPVGCLEVIQELSLETVPFCFLTGKKMQLCVADHGQSRESILILFAKWAENPMRAPVANSQPAMCQLTRFTPETFNLCQSYLPMALQVFRTFWTPQKMGVLLRLQCVQNFPSSDTLDTQMWKQTLVDTRHEPPSKSISLQSLVEDSKAALPHQMGSKSHSKGCMQNITFLLTFDDVTPSKGTLHVLKAPAEVSVPLFLPCFAKPRFEANQHVHNQTTPLLESTCVPESALLEYPESTISVEIDDGAPTPVLIESENQSTDCVLKRVLKNTLVELESPVVVDNPLHLSASQALQAIKKRRKDFTFETRCKLKHFQDMLEEVIRLPWPAAKSSKFHDVYYCRDESSEQSAHQCSETSEKLVSTETASIFSLPSSARDLVLKGPLPLQRRSDVSIQKPSSSQRTPRKRTSSSSASLRRSPRLKSASHNGAKEEVKKWVESKSSPGEAPGVTTLSETYRKKLRCAVARALKEHGIGVNHPLFMRTGKKLFFICCTLVLDFLPKDNGRGGHSGPKQGVQQMMFEVARAHAEQVVKLQTQFSSQ